MNEVLSSLSNSMERLAAAARAIELAAEKLEQREATMSGDVQKITAAVESGGESLRRELDLERKLGLAEQEIATLQAQAGTMRGATGVRKTLPAATVHLLAKGGIDRLDTLDLGTLDAALSGLSIEQRLAVKSQLLRSGALIS